MKTVFAVTSLMLHTLVFILLLLHVLLFSTSFHNFFYPICPYIITWCLISLTKKKFKLDFWIVTVQEGINIAGHVKISRIKLHHMPSITVEQKKNLKLCHSSAAGLSCQYKRMFTGWGSNILTWTNLSRLTQQPRTSCCRMQLITVVTTISNDRVNEWLGQLHVKFFRLWLCEWKAEYYVCCFSIKKKI